MRLAWPALLLSCLLTVAGCKADLYSDLTEVEDNQMLAALMSNGVPAEKVNNGKAFTLKVEERDMVRAIEVLDAKGYPKNTRQSMGAIFQKSGIISSPFEERIRYIYALGQEVEKTLSEIDGVVSARVHIVLPDQPELGQAPKPSSAAVFIKQEPSVDLEFLVPQIRRLVSSSIEGLDYTAVTVVLTEAMPVQTASKSNEENLIDVLPGLAVREQDVDRFWQIAYGVCALIALLLVTSVAGGVALLMRRRGSGRGSAATSGSGTDTALEPS
jgi:type III secretion protein J